MRRILYVVLAFSLVCTQVSFGAGTLCQSATSGGTLIVFGNGIMNTKSDAAESLVRIAEVLYATLPPEEFNKLKFDLAYNKSYGFFADLYESAKQKLLSDNLPVSFWRWLGNREIMPDALKEELKAMAVRFDFSTMVGSADLVNHIDLYRLNMLAGNKVVVFAHSQGNFFVNAAYSSLFTGSQALTTAQSFGIVSVANPASFVAGGGPYTTLVEDLVIAAIALATPTGVSPPLFPNITNVLSGAETSDWKGHGFLEEYMAQGSRSVTQIMSDGTAMIASRVTPPTVIQDGIITVSLTWGVQPDVDLHAFEPNGTHVFYAHLQGPSGKLDLDDTTSYGPEHYTVSCSTLETGTYHIGVNYYYGSSPEVANIHIQAGLSTRSFTRNLPTALGSSGNGNPVPVADIVVTGNQQDGFSFDVAEQVAP